MLNSFMMTIEEDVNLFIWKNMKMIFYSQSIVDKMNKSEFGLDKED